MSDRIIQTARVISMTWFPVPQEQSTLDSFEQLVLSQTPAQTAWQPVTDYSFKARTAIEGKHPELIRDVFHPTRVLDAGCGPGHLVRMLNELGVMTLGADTCGTGKNFTLDLSEPARAPWLHSLYDLVICREVLEHLTLRQIRQAVTNLCLLSSRYVYVTTRFSSEHDLLHVETKDDLDPTHITIPSKDLIRLLFVLEGFKRCPDKEEAMDWQKKNRCLVYERVQSAASDWR